MLDFNAVPKIDDINKKTILNDDNVPLDPLGYSTGTGLTITNAVTRSTPNEDEVDVTHTSDAGLATGDPCIVTGVVGMTDLNRAFLVDTRVSATVTRLKLLTDQVYVSGGSIQETILATTRAIPTIIEDIFQIAESTISIAGGTLDVSGSKWEMNTSGNKRIITGALFDTPIAGRVRITVSTTTGFVVGDDVFIQNVIGMTDLNAEFVIDAVPSSTEIDVVLATAQTYISGGIIVEIDSPIGIWGTGTSFINDGGFFLFSTSFPNGLNTLGDVLRGLCRDWFCWAGMVHQESAFFKRLYEYQTSNNQTLGTVLEKKTRYMVGLLDYVKVQGRGTDPRFFDEGTVTNLEHRSLNIDAAMPAYWRPIGGFGQTNVTQGGNAVLESKDPLLDDTAAGWEPHGKLLARLYQDARSTMANNRVVEFTVTGVGYDILQSVNHENEGFWLIGLRKNFKAGTSVLTCIFIEAT